MSPGGAFFKEKNNILICINTDKIDHKNNRS